LPPGRGHGRGQVDEIAAVREGVPDPRAAARGAEGAGGGGVEGRRRPLALVLEEDLDGAAAEIAAPRRRQGQAARDRNAPAPPGGCPPSCTASRARCWRAASSSTSSRAPITSSSRPPR